MDEYYTELSSVALIIVIIVSLNLILGTTSKKPRSKKLPPSPPWLPIIGHLWYLFRKTPFHRTAQRLSQQYGPVVGLWFGSRRVVLISSPAAVQECFTKNDVILANRPRLLMTQHVGYNCTTVTTAPYGDHWRNLRRITAIEIFSAARLRAFAGIRRDEIRRLLVKLYDPHGGGVVEMKSLLSEMTFNIIMRMVAGKRYYGDDVADKEEAVRFREIMKEAVESAGVANPADFLPVLKWFGGGGEGYERKVMRIAKNTDAFLQGLIDEVRTKREEGNTMIHHLLSLQDSQPECHTDQIIKGLILVLLLAGTDTSSVTLEWAMSNLLNNSNVLKKAKAEIDSKVGEKDLIDESDISKLDYLQSIISETLRLYPAAPLLVPHYSSEDFTVGGYHVPRDTIVLINAWSMHRDPSLWDEPKSFKPERFPGGFLELTTSNKLVPFGMGRRACPGSGLAQRVVGLALGAMIQCFEWERVSEGLVDMTEGRGVTLPKAVPLEAICKPRPLFVNVVLPRSADDI